MQGSRGWAEKSDFLCESEPRCSHTVLGIQNRGDGTNPALHSGPVRGCNFFARAISAPTDGGHIETSFYRGVE
jgi:hypothetical protein